MRGKSAEPQTKKNMTTATETQTEARSLASIPLNRLKNSARTAFWPSRSSRYTKFRASFSSAQAAAVQRPKYARNW